LDIKEMDLWIGQNMAAMARVVIVMISAAATTLLPAKAQM
jgi:hypothetical protein